MIVILNYLSGKSYVSLWSTFEVLSCSFIWDIFPRFLFFFFLSVDVYTLISYFSEFTNWPCTEDTHPIAWLETLGTSTVFIPREKQAAVVVSACSVLSWGEAAVS